MIQSLHSVCKAVNRRVSRILPAQQYARLVNGVCKLLPMYARLDISRTADGAGWIINDGVTTIHVVTPRRASLYRLSVERRLSYLAERYRLANFVEVMAGDMVLDIGANIGEFGIAHQGLFSLYIAIEPDQAASNCLRRNMAEDNIPYQHYGEILWKEHAYVPFRNLSESADSGIVIDRPAIQTERRRAITLDGLIRRRFSATFIKMDAEGAEPEVIDGGRGVFGLAEAVAIDCGCERNGLPTDVAVSASLKELGYNVRTYQKMVFGNKRKHGRKG
jgi:FkbM family methyltransferase